jgi:hypothetical protein
MSLVVRVYGLVSVIGLVLWIFCIIDSISAREDTVRNLPKLAWIFIVLLFPFVGSLAWLVAGRPQSTERRLHPWERAQPEFPEYDRPGRAAAVDPEQDAEFLRQVRERAEEQRRAYREKRARELEQESERSPADDTADDSGDSASN